MSKIFQRPQRKRIANGKKTLEREARDHEERHSSSNWLRVARTPQSRRDKRSTQVHNRRSIVENLP